MREVLHAVRRACQAASQVAVGVGDGGVDCEGGGGVAANTQSISKTKKENLSIHARPTLSL